MSTLTIRWLGAPRVVCTSRPPSTKNGPKRAFEADRQVGPHKLTGLAPVSEVVDPQVVRVGAGEVDHRHPAGLRVDDRVRAPGGRQRALLVLLEQHRVLAMVAPHLVHLDDARVGVLGVGEAAVDEARAVGQPVDAGHLVGDLVGQPLAVVDPHQVQRGVLVAATVEAEGHQLAVRAGLGPGERGEALGVERVGVQQGARLAVVPRAHVEDRLRLLALALEVEVAAAARVGGADRADGQQLVQPRLEPVAALEVVEHGAGVAVLGLGPGRHPGVELGVRLGDLGRVAALEPAVGVDQLDAVEGLGDRLDGGRRRRRGCGDGEQQ